MKKLYIILAILGAFYLGAWAEAAAMRGDVAREIKKWHTAVMFEDGSWRVNYKDGTIGTGCFETGICRNERSK